MNFQTLITINLIEMVIAPYYNWKKYDHILRLEVGFMSSPHMCSYNTTTGILNIGSIDSNQRNLSFFAGNLKLADKIAHLFIKGMGFEDSMIDTIFDKNAKHLVREYK